MDSRFTMLSVVAAAAAAMLVLSPRVAADHVSQAATSSAAATPSQQASEPEHGCASDTDAATVTECLTMLDQNTIVYGATVDDPLVYTRPFTIGFMLMRHTTKDFEISR